VCAALRARRWQPSIPPGRYFRLALRQFLKPGARQALPDHSVLLQLVAEHTLAKGRGVGVDASTMEGNAAMRSIMRRAAGAGWAGDAGYPRTRAGKVGLEFDWASSVDPPGAGRQSPGPPAGAPSKLPCTQPRRQNPLMSFQINLFAENVGGRMLTEPVH
jgi:hypothetical protein